jgi:pilus assembly protein Flp/PilA
VTLLSSVLQSSGELCNLIQETLSYEAVRQSVALPIDWCNRCFKGSIGKQAPVPFTLNQERERKMKNLLARLWKEEEGQDLTEYALLLVLVALAAIGTLGTLANAINNTFSKAAQNLT